MTDFLYKIAAALDLGAVTESPQPLTGGFLHRMYSLLTDRGHYAVKLLNPHIMARPDAMNNFRRAETLESRLEHAAIPILPALSVDGRKMQQLDGQYFYLFDWFDGRALPSNQVTDVHCRTVGALLAKIHQIEQRSQPGEYKPLSIDWDGLTAPFADADPELFALLQQHRNLLYEIQSLANAAFPRLPAVTAVCHNDMDCKNVLWRGGECRIIDLECLGWSNPHLELYETALCWSGIEQCRVDKRRFAAFIRAYSEAGGALPSDWTVIHDANTGRLGWLEYNLSRALGVGCSSEEVSVGASEVRRTLAQLAHYREIKDRLFL